MTLIVSILSPQYALVMSDNKSIIQGPAQFNRMDGSTVSLDVEEHFVVEDDPRLEKVFLSNNRQDAFAHSGTRDGEDPFFISLRALNGPQADEAIFDKVKESTRFAELPFLLPGKYPGQGWVHVYKANNFFLASILSSDPATLTRKTYRSGGRKLVWVAAGSGEKHVQDILSNPSFQETWNALCQKTELTEIESIMTFWSQIFLKVSARQYDVNKTTSFWLLTQDSSEWIFKSKGHFQPQESSNISLDDMENLESISLRETNSPQLTSVR